MGVEQACESMQEDWERLLLRMGSAVVQQAWASACGVSGKSQLNQCTKSPNLDSSC